MTDQPMAALAASIHAVKALESVIAIQVAECRRAGHTWNEIAAITGVSKPTALNKWKDKTDMTNTTTTSPQWTLSPGDRVRRRDLHRHFGGNIQSGIAPCRDGDLVLLFASPRGENHGYTDGPNGDGTYRYTGEGQRGDQTMTRGNRAILDHRANGKQLQLFEGDGTGFVTYVGEFEYDTHGIETIPGTGASGQRDGIIFTLRQV